MLLTFLYPFQTVATCYVLLKGKCPRMRVATHSEEGTRKDKNGLAPDPWASSPGVRSTDGPRIVPQLLPRRTREIPPG